MKKLGCLLITIGFLTGAFGAVQNKETVQWAYFAGGLLVGAAGVALLRTSHRRASTSEGKLTENIESVETALAAIAGNIVQLNSQKQSINTYDVRHRIDELFPNEIGAFVQARQSIAHIYGLSAYGDVMSCFAAGERYLNRVWSASADGYIDEVNTYLEKATEQFTEGLEKVRRLKVEAVGKP